MWVGGWGGARMRACVCLCVFCNRLCVSVCAVLSPPDPCPQAPEKDQVFTSASHFSTNFSFGTSHGC